MIWYLGPGQKASVSIVPLFPKGRAFLLIVVELGQLGDDAGDGVVLAGTARELVLIERDVSVQPVLEFQAGHLGEVHGAASEEYVIVDENDTGDP